jgi:hypothetical protein
VMGLGTAVEKSGMVFEDWPFLEVLRHWMV